MLVTTLIIIIFILLVLGGALTLALMIQSKKNRIYEQWISDLQRRVNTVTNTIVALDNLQMFSKDDEVGSVFSQMVELVKSLNQMTGK
jgi:hypothetical protein